MSYCEVDFSDASDDAEPVDFFNVVTVKSARKAHVCCECGGTIQPGESYRRANYKFDGVVGTDALCEPCDETKAEFNYHIFGGDLWASLREEWENGAHVQSCIARLTTARAKEHMRQQWLKWKGLAK
jgi:hypothetical protein